MSRINPQSDTSIASPFDTSAAIAPDSSSPFIKPQTIAGSLPVDGDDLFSEDVRPFAASISSTMRSRKESLLSAKSLSGESLPFSVPAVSDSVSTLDVPPIYDVVTGQSSEMAQVGVDSLSPSQSQNNSPSLESFSSDLLDLDELETMRRSQLKSLTTQKIKKAAKKQSNRAFSLFGLEDLNGSLGADAFSVSPTTQYSIVSGNGNVFFGDRYNDYLNLSALHSSTVQFNIAGINGNGVLYNDGAGTRVFDALTLSNGKTILFEGLDRVYFSNGYLNLATTPNDPYFADQWNLHMMGVQNAWRFTTGSKEDVLIGVQDTGLGLNSSGYIHPDLRTTYIYRENYADESYDLSHGTAVQSIIAAKSDNGVGMSGINWQSDVLHIDVLGGEANDYELPEATQRMINEANRQGRRLIINMSLGADTGGRSLYAEFDQLVRDNQENVLFVIATGNDDKNYLSYPANLAKLYDNVIAVGASWGTYDDDGNARTPGTRISYPGWWGSNYGDGISMMGPSEVIAAESYQGYYSHSFSYEPKFNGTSAATPNVAGVASLVWSANPNLSAREVHNILAQTSYDLGSQGYDLAYGHGFVNADAAVRRAIALR